MKLIDRKVGLVALALLLLVAACGGGTDDETTTTAAAGGEDTGRGTTLVVSHPQEPPNWNYWETGANAVRVPTYLNVLESLLETRPDGSIVPLLAESYDVTDDGLVYTFVIREAKFHDGSALDAADVVYSLEKNAESPVSALSAPHGQVTSVEALDDRTVQVTLAQPSQSFLSEMARAAGIIVPENSHEEIDWATTMVGTGPYTFGEYRPDNDITLNRFDDYWGEQPYFETFVQRFIADETAAINAFLAGELDIVGALLGEGKERIPTIEATDGLGVIRMPGAEVSYVFLNTNVEMFQDERVRQAIAHAIDRDALVEAALAGFGDVACLNVTPFTAPYNSDYCPYPYDPDRAKELLADAGYPDGITFDFPYLTLAEFPASMEVLVANWAAVGITAETRGQDLATWLDLTNSNSEYEVSHITDGVTIDNFICGGGRQPHGMEDSAVCDEAFDTAVVAADAIVDRDEYIAAMAAASNGFADSAWVIPVFSSNAPLLYREELSGIKEFRSHNELDIRNIRRG